MYSLDIETPPEKMFGPPTAEYLKHPLSKYLDYLDDLGVCICDSTLGPPKINLQNRTSILGCPWKLVTMDSKLGYNLFRGRIQPTYIRVII